MQGNLALLSTELVFSHHCNSSEWFKFSVCISGSQALADNVPCPGSLGESRKAGRGHVSPWLLRHPLKSLPRSLALWSLRERRWPNTNLPLTSDHSDSRGTGSAHWSSELAHSSGQYQGQPGSIENHTEEGSRGMSVRAYPIN